MINTLQNFRLISLSSLTILPAILLTTVVKAQIPPSGANTTTVPNIGNSNFGRLNNVKPIQQPGSFSDSTRGSSSQQFFHQGREQLFFLPENHSEPILQIDEEIKEMERDNQKLERELERR
ncbi:MAG: hypothetical protein AAF298_18745 [Cyanobacteria bacterium P01_A01_bin.40]